MCLRMRSRCRCWEALALAAVAVFSPLERQGLRAPCPAPDGAHVTASRVIARIRYAPAWILAGAAVFALHIRTIQQEVPPCPHS